MRSIMSALFAASLLSAAPLAAAVPAPKVRAATFDQLAKPLPLPYDEAANANAVVNAARQRARATGKRLLIDLGGNWCLDCRILAGTVELPELKRWVAQHYELVAVDIGRFDKNLQIPARYGFRDRLKGVPALLVVDPRSDRLLNGADTTALADARSMNPQGLADYLAKWAR
jgi:thiol-disulfide isomerase/thioredoxin